MIVNVPQVTALLSPTLALLNVHDPPLANANVAVSLPKMNGGPRILSRTPSLDAHSIQKQGYTDEMKEGSFLAALCAC